MRRTIYSQIALAVRESDSRGLAHEHGQGDTLVLWRARTMTEDWGADSAQAGHAPAEEAVAFPIRHILVPLDGSPLAECVLPFARALGDAYGAKISMLRVLEPALSLARASGVDALDWEVVRAEAYGYLARLAAHWRERGRESEVQLLQGRAEEQILQFASGQGVDLIALTSHGAGGLTKWNLSSTAHMVLDRAATSVLLVPAYAETHDGADRQWPLRRLMLTMDCSRRAEFVLPLATRLARFHGAELLLTHVVRVPDLPRRLLPSSEDVALAERLADRNRQEAGSYLARLSAEIAVHGVRARVLVRSAHRVSPTLCQIALEEDADLVMVCAHGTSGRTGEALGTTASALLRQISKPILLLQDMGRSVLVRTAAEKAATDQPGH